MTITEAKPKHKDSVLAEFLASRGYTVAGFTSDLYEGAEYIIPAGHNDMSQLPEYHLGSDEWWAQSEVGRVLEITHGPSKRRWWQRIGNERERAVWFVYLDEHGNQVPRSFHKPYALYMKYNPKAS